MFHYRWMRLVMFPAVVAGIMSGPAMQPAAAATDWGIQKDDKVVTVYDCPLREESRVVATIPAGTEVTVSDVQGDWVRVTTTILGDSRKGWLQAKYLRTPATLKKLTALADEFKEYQLWTKGSPSLPVEVSFRRFGRPTPLSDLSISSSGAVSVQVPSDVSDEKKDRAATSLEEYVRQYMLERCWPRTFDSSSSWQVLVAYDRTTLESESGRSRALLHGHFFLLNTSSKMLVYYAPLRGEGLTDEEMYRSFAKQAAAEYGEIVVRWGSTPSRPEFKPPFTPSRRPPFGPPF